MRVPTKHAERSIGKGVRLPESLFAWLKRVAKRERCTVNQAIAQAVREAMEREASEQQRQGVGDSQP